MRRKATIYLDTSVPGAFFDPPDSPVYKATATFWDNVLPDYDAYISELVEIEIADLKNISRRKKLESLIRKFKVLEVSQEAVEVSQEYLKLLRIPERDALHVAIASVEGMDYLVTWNLRHLARERTRRAADYINLTLLLKTIVIYTPLDFIDEVNMEKKEATRWELGCFDIFESPFLNELHKIRREQSEKPEGLSPGELAEHIKYQVRKLRKGNPCK